MVTADSLQSACSQVEDFFANTMLVNYDKVIIDKSSCINNSNSEFIEILESYVEANRNILQRFVNEFSDTGFSTVKDLLQVECGYPSKLLHIITHFLDGFIGIDSSFYNIHEDSHWVSEEIKTAIRQNKGDFWIIRLDCYSDSPEKVSLVQA